MKPTTIRAMLYCIALFLSPFTEKVVPVLNEGKWPLPQALLGTCIVGVVAAVIGLRAYLDGSAERARMSETVKPKPPEM